MTAFLLSTLFLAAGGFAAFSIAAGLQRYGAAALALRDQLRDCPEWREVRVTTHETIVRPGGAAILRPAFKARRQTPAAPADLPAAA